MAANEALLEVSSGPSELADPPQPERGGGMIGASDAQQPGSDPQSMDQNSDQCLKRPWEAWTDFISHNRPVRRRKISEESFGSFQYVLTHYVCA